MKTIIEFQNLTKVYSKNNKDIVVLDSVSYKFESGKFYLIMGKSGAGKSTLVQLLGLFLNASSGDIIIDGKNTKKLTESAKADLRNKKIGFVFQSFYLNPMMKAYENVMLPMYLNCSLKRNEIKNIACNILHKLGLNGRENHYPKELSGGEQQRVAIARALANNPDIILADEPTGALDNENETLILKELKKLSLDGKCVIVVSHNKEVKNYADEIIFIRDKKMVGDKNEK